MSDTSPAENEATIEEMMEMLAAFIDPIIRRINLDEFTTVEFVQALNMDPSSSAAYEEAVRRWPDRDPRLSKLVVHGQVIPALLRRSTYVEWNGYAYGEDDPYAVPARWKKINPS